VSPRARQPRLRLPFPPSLALRYLRSTRRDAFVTFLSAVAGGGLVLGVAALILALSALSGFHDVLLGEVRDHTPDIEVVPGAGQTPGGLEADLVRRPEVAFVQQIVQGRGWLVSADRIRAVEMIGFEKRLPASFPRSIGAKGDDDGLYVGDTLMTVWGLEPGQIVEVASNLPTLTPFGPQPRLHRLVVAGSYVAARTEEQERVAIPLASAETLFDRPERRLELELAPGASPAAVARRLRAELPTATEVSTWRELNRPLLFALHLEKGLMFVAVSLIVLVAALALIADLALIVSNKRPELGMLRAMGASPRQLRRAFLWLGGLLAAGSTVLGAVLGVVAAVVLDRTQLLSLSGNVYFIHYVPFHVRPLEVAEVMVLATILSIGGAAFVARRASGLLPVEALRR
jgi:lipoprotein-releasing system permease protein